MARPFNKRPAKWLELPSTKDFLNELAAIRKSDRLLIETVNGVGTWTRLQSTAEFLSALQSAKGQICLIDSNVTSKIFPVVLVSLKTGFAVLLYGLS